MFEKGSCCLFMCCSSQEACFRREINVPSGMASLLCCRSSMRAATPTVTSPMPTPFLRYPHSTSPSKEAVKWLVLASSFFFLLSVLLWKLVGKIVMWPLFFLAVIIIPAVCGGHVLCHRGQEDRSGIHLPQHVHFWPLWWSWCKSYILVVLLDWSCYFWRINSHV